MDFLTPLCITSWYGRIGTMVLYIKKPVSRVTNKKRPQPIGQDHAERVTR